jgi:hypothetical protein
MERKKSPPRRGFDPVKVERKRQDWLDPVKRANMLKGIREANAKRKAEGRYHPRLGVPEGMRKWEADLEWNFARMYAKEVTKIMVDNGTIEDPKVEQAFKAAVEVLHSPMSQTIKLQAARLILDFCKAKPVQKSEVTVATAEDWLQQVTADAIRPSGS